MFPRGEPSHEWLGYFQSHGARRSHGAGGRIPTAEGGVAGVGKRKRQRRRFNGDGAEDAALFFQLEIPIH